MTRISNNTQGRIENLEQTLVQLQQLLGQQQQEIDCLRSLVTTQPVNPVKVATGRRRFLKSLAGLGGAGVAALAFGSSSQSVQAKFVANSGAGAVVGLSSSSVEGVIPDEAQYGFIATARPALNLDNLLVANVGAYAEGDRYGVYGYCSDSVGERAGVRGVADGEYGRGVYGSVQGSSSYGLVGEASGASSTGVYGVALAANSSGVNGVATGTGSVGVRGSSSGQSLIAVGGYASSDTSSRGVYGEGRVGVEGSGSGGAGQTFRIGILGRGDDYAGLFLGSAAVTGTFSATTKQFRIDHPLDPANRYLQHASIESDKMLNIYTGTVTLDAAGQATVKLPGWFEVLNKDFTYHLTPFGTFSQAYIVGEIKNGQFQIAGGQAGQRVSWLVSGVRQDAWAKVNPLEVEKPKSGVEAGTYLHPELYNQPKEKSLSSKITALPPK